MKLAEVVAAAVRERRPELEALVREQVDATLRALVGDTVEAEVARRLNGAGEVVEPAPPPAAEVVEPPPTKRCSACGTDQPLAAFRPSRSVCKPCRNRQDRESSRRRRTQPDADEEPAPVGHVTRP